MYIKRYLVYTQGSDLKIKFMIIYSIETNFHEDQYDTMHVTRRLNQSIKRNTKL